ncbi:MAG: hypothetical protein QOE36_1680, partial [Gaiellaceae bacterium]|nr:hypothetical protein [Gaiellaceae bacterium]
LLALGTLYRRRLPVVFRSAVELVAGGAVDRLKALHDGVTGDYVAWLTFGTATIGVLFAVLIR